MAELLGEHHYQLDPKGRISLRAKFRDAFSDGVFLTMGQDGCLFAFPREEWEKRQREVRALSISNPDNRAYSRMFFGSAERVELDAQGRLVLPRALRETARLGREVVVVGVSDRLEIWDGQEWARYRSAYGTSYASGALTPER